MTRLVWDELPGRRYEAGVSHGVFYPLASPGTVWNGLISVAHTVAGAEQTAFHQDGVKYYDFIGGRDYQADVSAYSAPSEFAPFAGEKELSPGIRLAKQPKARFNFSYQTHYEDGYKIHLVYNVLATPGTEAHVSEGATPSPTVLTWTFDAVPVSPPGFKPSAHYVVDSNRAELVLLNELEATLYGTGISNPVFPSIEDLVMLFTEVLP